MTDFSKSWLDLPAPPPVTGMYEMVLEVADLAASEQFYMEAIGLPVATRWGDERPATWMTLGNEGFLGLWPVSSGGAVAIHKGRGGAHVHFALRIPLGTIDQAQARLEELGHEVERVDFGNGNIAIYLDDPDGNVVELTEISVLWDAPRRNRSMRSCVRGSSMVPVAGRAQDSPEGVGRNGHIEPMKLGRSRAALCSDGDDSCVDRYDRNASASSAGEQPAPSGSR